MPSCLVKRRIFFALGFGHVVGHDGEGGNAEVVEVDDVVEAFDEDQTVLSDEFSVAGFFEAAGVLADEFDDSVEAFGKTVVGGRIIAGAIGGGELLVFLFFLFELHVAPGPCQDFALLGEHGVEDAAAE
jgi:hypothetical protein